MPASSIVTTVALYSRQSIDTGSFAVLATGFLRIVHKIKTPCIVPAHAPSHDRHRNLDILDALGSNRQRVVTQNCQVRQLTNLDGTFVMLLKGQTSIIDREQLKCAGGRNTLVRIGMVDGAMHTIEWLERCDRAVEPPPTGMPWVSNVRIGSAR